MSTDGGFMAALGNSGRGLLDRIGAGMWDSLWGGITSGNWGGTSKERKNQIHDIRTLRRREYQDMVHSLKEAGLNPLLAVGASPGHASASTIPAVVAGGGSLNTPAHSAASAAHRKAGVAEGKAPSEIDGDKVAAGKRLVLHALVLQ